MLNENIKNFRKQKGYTQETLAQELNIVRQTVSKWEKGYSVPDAVMLEQLADIFEISVSELLGNSESDTEQKPNLELISAQLSVLNNQLAKELTRKRKKRKVGKIILAVILIVALILGAFIFFPNIYTENSPLTDGEVDVPGYNVSKELDKAVSDTILKNNSSENYLAEFITESHYIYGTKESGNTVTVYLMENLTGFGFEDGYFVETTGHLVPSVFTYKNNGSSFELLKSEYAEDGEHYTSSIKKLFPLQYKNRVLKGLSEEERTELWLNSVVHAQRYLISIGRENVEVHAYNEIVHTTLYNLGVPIEICNELAAPQGFNTDIGNYEKVENGTRYVYQTEYDEHNNRITFTKFEYGTNKIVEFSAADATNGKLIPNSEKPKTVKYRKAQLSTANEKYTTVFYTY